MQPVGVFVEKTEPEDAQGVRVGAQFLDHEIVVLAGLDVGAVLADGMAYGLVGGFVRVLERGDLWKGPAAPLHGALDEGVARARGRRRSQHLDFRVGQRRVDLAPPPVGVRHQLAVPRHPLGKGQEQLS